ncbi:MAG: leucine-rich repeat protein [Bacteroidales bacterium]
MKSYIIIIFCMLSICSYGQHTLTAEDVTIDGETITAYTGTATEIIIPTEIGGAAITKIGEKAFEGKSLTSVIINDGIKTIARYAFRYNKINFLTLPSTLTNLGQRCFEKCTFESIVIPEGITDLEYLTFRNNSALTSVVLPKYITKIDRAFAGCTALTSIILPSDVPKGHAVENGWQLYEKVGGSKISEDIYSEILPENFGKGFVRSFIEQSAAPVELTADMVTITDGVITTYSASDINLIIPQSIGGKLITGIAADAFANKGLIAVSIDANSALNSIGAGAFANNDASLSIVLPEGSPEDMVYEVWKNESDAEVTEITNSNWTSSFSRATPTISNYTIIYHNGEEIVSLEPASYTVGSETDLPDYKNPVNEHAVVSWCVDASLYNPIANFEEAVEYADGSTIHLYAKWEYPEYKIQYNLFGGTNHEDNPYAYNYESETFEIKAPTKAGDTFVKWSLDVNGASTAPSSIVKGEASGNITLYAVWQGVTYDYYALKSTDVTITDGNITAYSGSGHAKIFIPSVFENGATASAVWHASKTGAFESNKELTHVVFAEGITRIGEDAFHSASNLQSIIFPSSISRTDYRSFRRCALTEVLFSGNSNFNYVYKLSFDGNSNLDQPLPSDAPIGYTASTWLKGEEEVATISAKNSGEIKRTIEPSAYALEASDLKIDANGVITDYLAHYVKISIPQIIGGKLITGIAENVFQSKSLEKVLIDNNSAIASIGANAFANNTANLVVKLPTKYPEALFFEDWKDADGNAITEITTNNATLAFSRKQITTQTFTIVYKDGDTVLNLEPNSYTIGEELNFPDTPKSKIDAGYELQAWYVDAAWSTLATNHYEASKLAVDNVITYYAKWKPIIYTITYNLNGGVLAENSPKDYTVESAEFIIPEPTKEEYIFDKWTSDETGFLTVNPTIATGSVGDRVLYANWNEVEIEYTTISSSDITFIDGIISAYTGTAENIIIPAYIGEEAVTSVAANTFANKGLKNIIFESPSELASVDASAFVGNNFEEIILPTGSVYGTRVESWKNAEGVFTPSISPSAEHGIISREVMTFSFKPRMIEKLNRGLVAMQSADGIFLSWRIFGSDPHDIAFNIYKNGELLNSEPHTSASNVIDPSGTTDDTYQVEALAGDDQGKSKEVKPWKYTDKKESASRPDISVLRIKMPEKPIDPLGGTRRYTPGDMSVGDLDGDGEYELVFIWESAESESVSGLNKDHRCPVVDAVKLDGTHLWRIHGGPNTDANGLALMVYDLDGDGKAEVAMKTGPGTKDGTGEFLSNGPAANDNDGVFLMRGGRGHLMKDPAYVTVFNGSTGAEIATVDYWPSLGPVEDINKTWGDNDGYRAASIKSAVLVDQERGPQLVFSRGIYTRIAMQALCFDGDKLTQAWTFDQLDYEGELPDSGEGKAYFGEGNHSISIGDVDFDGSDELMYGACAIDNDGNGLYSTGRGHGDADHLGDLMPDRPGLEFFQPHENSTYGVSMRDAATGNIIWEYLSSGDIGRAWAGNVTADFRGFECISILGDGIGNLDCNGEQTGKNYNAYNQPLYFDDDLFSDLRHNGNGINSSSGLGRILTGWHYGATTIHSTKDDVNLQADLFGDWREELVFINSDLSEFIVFTTWIPTTHKMYTLMHDPLYRMNIVRQNIGYNQPAHLGFYLEDGVQTPYVSYEKQWEDYSVTEPEPEPVISYNITYNLGIDGATHSNPYQVTVGTPIFLNKAKAKGYRFMNWYADENFTQRISALDTLQTENVELWARWKKLGEFHAYPTVTADYITVSTTDDNDTINIVNSTGIIVKKISLNSRKQQIYVGDLVPGHYVVRSDKMESVHYIIVQ